MLTITELHVGYETSHVLNGIGFTIGGGESVALLGRNGMGKTTLVRAICGLTPPTITAGGIDLDGVDLRSLSKHDVARAGIGLVPQGRHVFGSLTVLENLAVVRQNKTADDPWTVERVFSFFPRLEERVKSYAQTLSGGEQQMLAIGRALMTNPRVLIMDEPSEGLAPAVLRVIEDRLQELRRTGLSVLVAEQNVDLALSLSDRVIILGEDGRVAWTGGSELLAADPAPIHTHLGL
ncbi:ABC transporter ATP-binding protein [Parafrigoribacterium humi]|jgi:branched-chain amino acid transport system ATP-binding protein|uniref:ABC transporter ATP-binding protein n=1 Tax=Parafrigoribacterium humi TaxID=3144664 RepID=UPI0032EC7187